MKSFTSRKLILKIFSFVSGFLIWVYVVSSAQIELSKEVKIRIELPDQIAIKNKVPKNIIYRVKGPAVFVRQFIEEKNKELIFKESYFKKNKKFFTINLEKIKLNLPLGVELVSVEPRLFTIELEKSFTKTVPIKADFSPGVLEKYNIQKLVLWPKTIDVSGPKSLVRSIQSINTKELDTLGLGIQQELDIELINPDERLSLSEKVVKASMVLITKTKSKLFKKVPIIFQSKGLIKYASQKDITIELIGNDILMDQLDTDSIQVIASIPSSMKGKGEFSIELITELPQGIKVKDMSPKLIRVKVE